jgi:hypothetical protein
MNIWMSLFAVSLLCLTAALAGHPGKDGREGGGAAAQSPGGAGDEQAIRQVIAAVFDAANRRDAKAGTLLFTSDADFVSVLGMWWKGAAEIEREWGLGSRQA